MILIGTRFPVIVLALSFWLSTAGIVMPVAIAAAAAAATPVAVASSNAPGDLTTYEINVTLKTETRQLVGTETIDWQNTTGQPQESLYLRLYPNADYYGEAETSVRDVGVDGNLVATPVATSVATPGGDDPTVLPIPLGRVVAPGDRVSIALSFVTVVPLGSSGSFGIFQLDPKSSVWTLADWYPILAGWESSAGAWYLDRPTTFGDPTFSETATYEIGLTAPGTLKMVGTGDVTNSLPAIDGNVLHTITTGPVREFAMTLLPDAGPGREVVQTTRDLAGVTADTKREFTVRLTLPVAAAIPGLEEAILDAVTAALPIYAKWLGTLPSDEIDLATASLDGATGVSWSGLVLLDVSSIILDGVLSDQERMGLTFVVTHEIGHQWIGGVIGSNSNDHGFMSEGLTNALALDVLRELEGPEAASAYLQGFVAGGYAALVRDGRDAIADAPITNDMNGVIRGLAVYGKAGLGFEAIRQELGEVAFRAAMTAYAAQFRFGIATPEDLLASFTSHERRDENIMVLWTFWFERADTKLADVEAVFAGAGS